MSFKSGTYKGLDLTFVNIESKIYGGILIRGIMDLGSKQYVDGPCLSVNKLLGILGATDCKELKLSTWPKHDGDAFDPTNETFYLRRPEKNMERRDLSHGPRVGLTLKRADKYKETFIDKNYRFLSFAHLCKKQKKNVKLAPRPSQSGQNKKV